MKQLFFVFLLILLVSCIHSHAASNQPSTSYLSAHDNNNVVSQHQVMTSGELTYLYSVAVFTDTISGTVFNDLGGDGVKGVTDPGLTNWLIRLFQASVQIDSTTSGTSGSYFFSNLMPGTYTVSEELQNGWAQTLPASNGSYTVSILDGQNISGNDFGNFQLATVGGTKFEDLNGNSVKNIGDPGLANWRIHLFENDVHVDSMLTDVNGNYSFSNLGPGTYKLSEQSQAGWTQTLPVSQGLYTVVPQSGQNVTGKDFGNFHLISISGMKFKDINGNGIKDGGDPPLSNWRIRLFLTSVYVDSALTDGSGNYAINNVGPGTYTVSEQVQTGWTQTFPALNAPYTITTQSGQNVTTRDFGNFQNGTISGMKFRDLDADGVKDGGEPGLANWRIRLNRGIQQIDSLLTDGSGNYTFNNVGPGTLTVSEQLQGGWTQTMPLSPGTYSVTLQSGQSVSGRDFGNARNSTLSGMAFYDRNANGVVDSGENGLTGWTINAVATLPQNSRSVVTQAGGLYTINNLVSDTYTISLVVKPNWSQTFPPSSTYTLMVSSVFDTSGFDFGAATITDTLKYRTFPPESLLVRRAITKRRANSRWCFAFTNNNTTFAMNRLHVVFSNVVDAITGKTPFTSENRLTPKEYEFSGASIPVGQTVQICGIGSRYGMRVKRSWWAINDFIPNAKGGALLPLTQNFIFTMPNTANIRNEIFLQYFATGMTIGIPRPDARTVYGWAVIPKSLSMYSSMIAGGFTHTGAPGGFVQYKGKPFVGKKITLNPAYHNNRLVADLISLKFNIAASAIGKTPPGLGELIYEEDSNPLSGLTLNQIAARADSNLTFWVGVPSSVFTNLDTVIKKIDLAFTGPPDTFYVGNEIKFTGVRSVNDVPFLRPSPDLTPIIVTPKTDLTEDVPEVFQLYQNYPNPFNPTTTIQFDLPSEALVTLKVYNLLGQEIATLIDREHMYDGLQEIEFDASSFPSSVYFYRIVAEGWDDSGNSTGRFTMVKKMLLLK